MVARMPRSFASSLWMSRRTPGISIVMDSKTTSASVPPAGGPFHGLREIHADEDVLLAQSREWTGLHTELGALLEPVAIHGARGRAIAERDFGAVPAARAGREKQQGTRVNASHFNRARPKSGSTVVPRGALAAPVPRMRRGFPELYENTATRRPAACAAPRRARDGRRPGHGLQ